MRLRPQTCSGDVGEDDVEGWVIHFENICAVNGTTGDAQKIALLSVSTAGAMTRWVRTNARWLSQEGRTWIDVKQRFQERFEDVDIEEKIYACLKSLRQGDAETVREYLGRFRELVACSTEVEEGVWYRSWVEGLLPPLHEAVMFTGYQNLEEASTLALRKECAVRCLSTLSSESLGHESKRLANAQVGSIVLLVQMMSDWALQAHDSGTQFPSYSLPKSKNEAKYGAQEHVRWYAPRGLPHVLYTPGNIGSV